MSMQSIYEVRRGEQDAIMRNIMQNPARMCSLSPFGSVCRALWPNKTAENLASRAHCSVRTASYQLSGEHRPSAEAVAVIVVAITRLAE